jgi:hypothetical protein
VAVIRPTFPDDHYTRVPNAWLRDPTLDPAPKAYLAYLLTHAAGYRCSTSQAARDMGVNRATVSGWNAKLVERGYFLAVEQTVGERGRFGENDYTITDCTTSAPPCPEEATLFPIEEGERSTVTVNRAPSPRDPARFTVHGPTDTDEPCTVNATHRRTREEEHLEKNTPRTPSGAVDALFVEFWTAYPRKVDRAAAWRAWQRVTRTTNPDKIIAAVREYPFDVSRIRYVKHPATWLNAGSWEDDLDAVRAAHEHGRPEFDLGGRDGYDAGDGTF